MLDTNGQLKNLSANSPSQKGKTPFICMMALPMPNVIFHIGQCRLTKFLKRHHRFVQKPCPILTRPMCQVGLSWSLPIELMVGKKVGKPGLKSGRRV